jgi:hypothetical protein
MIYLNWLMNKFYSDLIRARYSSVSAFGSGFLGLLSLRFFTKFLIKAPFLEFSPTNLGYLRESSEGFLVKVYNSFEELFLPLLKDPRFCYFYRFFGSSGNVHIF